MLRVVCSVPSAGAPISGALTAGRVSVVGSVLTLQGEPYWIGVGTQTASSRAAQGAQFNSWTSHQRPPSLCVQGEAGELCRPGNVGSGPSRALLAFREGRSQAEDFGDLQESIVPVGLCVDYRVHGRAVGRVSQAAESAVVLKRFPLIPGPCQGSQEETGEGEGTVSQGLSVCGIPGCGHLHGRECLQAKGSGATRYGTFPQGK